MTDHYELFGVDPGASKDEIKAAYRAEVENADSARRAQLNRAWNVLSDPTQRQRYDETLAAEGSGDGDGDGGGSEVSVVVPSRATGARRGPQSKAVDTNGSSNNGSSKNGSGGKGSGGSDGGGNDEPPRRPAPTILPPEGMVMAPAKQRSYAMAFDFSILVVIFVAVSYLGGQLIQNQYPAQTDRVDALTTQGDKADKAKSKADDAKDKADDAVDAAKKKGDSAALQDAKDKQEAAVAKAKAADKKSKSVNDALLKAQDELRPMYLLLQAVILILSLLYCVPMSVRTGQTLGKRLRKVRLVRLDGSAPGWSSSLIHYGLPIFLTLALVNILGPLALVLGLGTVLWNIRDKNRQGVHDKLAKTFVVEA